MLKIRDQTFGMITKFDPGIVTPRRGRGRSGARGAGRRFRPGARGAGLVSAPSAPANPARPRREYPSHSVAAAGIGSGPRTPQQMRRGCGEISTGMREVFRDVRDGLPAASRSFSQLLAASRSFAQLLEASRSYGATATGSGTAHPSRTRIRLVPRTKGRLFLGPSSRIGYTPPQPHSDLIMLIHPLGLKAPV